MTQFLLITLTGLGVGALYFLLSSGLSLIFGLMRVLNMAHGGFLVIGSYAVWWSVENVPGAGKEGLGFAFAVLLSVALGGVFAGLVEYFLIRPLYKRHIEQLLVTVGLGLAIVAVLQGMFSASAKRFPTPSWLADSSRVFGANIPNDRFFLIGSAVAVYVVLTLFLRRTRYGLIIRAGVENRSMVTALGIDVHQAFTLVFVIGGAIAVFAGTLYGVYSGVITPTAGAPLLIFAFVVVVIGGLGSLSGCALASIIVALTQQYANSYGATGIGDFTVVLLLAVVLLVRPGGLISARQDAV